MINSQERANIEAAILGRIPGGISNEVEKQSKKMEKIWDLFNHNRQQVSNMLDNAEIRNRLNGRDAIKYIKDANPTFGQFVNWIMGVNSFSEWVNQKHKIFIIVRGAPGSGKSKKVNDLLVRYGGNHNHVFSTDKMWIPETLKRRKNNEIVPEEEELEEYQRNFPKDIAGLVKGHELVRDKVKFAISQGISPILLDNTNTQWQNFATLAEEADKAGYIVKLEEPESPWWRAYRPFLKTKDETKLKELVDILTKNNKHGVPPETIMKMLNQWQEIDLDEKLGKKK